MAASGNWLISKRDDLVEEAARLTRQLERVEVKRELLDELIREWREPQTATVNGGGPQRDTPLNEEMSNVVAIDAVLSRSDEPLTIRDIAEAGKRLGKSLNTNSIRWELSSGIDEGRYVKLPPKEGERAKRYRMLN